jgi:hypothetical protein
MTLSLEPPPYCRSTGKGGGEEDKGVGTRLYFPFFGIPDSQGTFVWQRPQP